MAADERLMALKKAYADIILNTAKEAATRILASERKVQRFQQELQVGKDEALRMLLRLKQMMDTKIAHAELTSVSQQKKIDELEAQLQEAEDIVKDLREELREVQSELEQLRSKQQLSDERHSLAQSGEQNEIQYASSVAHPSNELEYVAAAGLRNATQFQINENFKFYSAAPHFGNLYLGCPDLPSIILRSKEPELYRNGCTQRIRASSEGKLLNRELSLSKQMSKGKDELSVQEDTGDREIISEPSNRMGTLGKAMKKEANSQLGVLNPVPSFRTTKKRATRHRKKIFSSSTSFANQLSCSNQAPEISHTTNYPVSVLSNTDFHLKTSSASRLSSDLAESGLETGCGEASENKRELSKSAHVPHNSANDVREKLMGPMQRETSSDISVVTVHEESHEKADNLLPIPETVESDVGSGFHGRPVNERVIKYTFQRKRKRESSCDFNVVECLDKDALKRQITREQNDSVEQEKSNLTMESSQDSQRLAQVASQLISLSETMQW